MLLNFLMNMLSHPLFVSLFTVAISATLLANISKTRDLKLQKRKEQIDFIDKTVFLLNSAISNIFRDLVSKTHECRDETRNAIDSAFYHRMRFALYAKELFGNEITATDYDEIIHCISRIADDLDKIAYKARGDHISQREILVEKWGISYVTANQEMLKESSGKAKERLISAEICFNSSKQLLTKMMNISTRT